MKTSANRKLPQRRLRNRRARMSAAQSLQIKNLCLAVPDRGFCMLFQLRVMGVSAALRLAQIAISVRMTIPTVYG